MQGHAADQLDVEVAHAHDTLTGFTGDRKGFGKQLVEGFTFGYAGLELLGLGAQLLVRKGNHLLFEGIDQLHRLEHAFDFALILASKKFL